MKAIQYIGIVLLLLFVCQKGTSQETVCRFSESFDMAASDPLGNFYLVRENQIKKIDSLGQVLYTFSNPNLGKISWLDSSDPFRILIYYRSFNLLIFLDRTLSPLGDPVRLDELEIFDPAGICRANQGGFWIIDQSKSSLIHLDSELNPQVNIRLSGFRMDQNDSWFPMLEWKERLYICRREESVLQFDLFGTLLKNIPAKAKGISFVEDLLHFIGDQKIYQYNDYPEGLSEPKMIDLPKWKQLYLSKNRALIQDQSGWQLLRLIKTH